jgi:uncharacterized membrane protein
MSWFGLALGLALVWIVTEIFGSRGAGLAVLGAVAGALIAGLHKRLDRGEAQWRQRVAELEAQVQALRQAAAHDATAPAAPAAQAPPSPPPAAAAPVPAAEPGAPGLVPRPVPAPAPTPAAPDPGFLDWADRATDPAAAMQSTAVAPSAPATGLAATPAPGPSQAASPAPAHAQARTHADPDESSLPVTTSLGRSMLAWIQGGNTIVRIAVLILLTGVAFLLRYAAQNVVVPLELRVAAVALGGLALAALGWRLRHGRRVYGLTLQGAGIGIVYITLFAAYRLYQMVPTGLTFALLAALSAITALLAVLQNAMPLAMFGFGGGFLAPVLASSGSGNHVALFSYYLLLNLGIAWIARRQAWKPLNLLGFVFTFSIGAAWGARAYTPQQFASTEPFLVAHFLLYLYISVQYTRQLVTANETRAMTLPTVDGGLLFGVPVAGFGLQAAMLHDQPLALALSAAVMSAVYLGVGRWLWRVAGQRMLLLVEGLLALGVIFLALVTPLALDARWTGVAWAVQGAGIVWVGLRQRRWWAALIGLLLQAGAALSFWGAYQRGGTTAAFLNELLLGALVLAASALLSARLLWRAAGSRPPPPPRWQEAAIALQWVMLVLGLGQALAGLWPELVHADLGPLARSVRAVALLGGFVLALELAARRLAWPPLRLCARVLLVLALVVSLGGTLMHLDHLPSLWAHYVPGAAVLATPLLVALGAWLLRRADGDAPPGASAAEVAALAWVAMWHAGLFAYLLGAHAVARHLGWTPAAAITGPTLIALWLVAQGRRAAAADGPGPWPMAAHGPALRRAVLLPWLALLLLWVLAVNAVGDTSMAPLPYLPLLNPLDLAHGLVLLYALALARLAPASMPAFLWPGAAMAFWWLNGLLVRTLHHWTGTPLWLDGALRWPEVQTSLTILWTLTACAAMWWAARHARRGPWMAGAGLLAAVVLKLFLVDLSNVGTLARIVSFLGVGGLMLVIGYVSPLPPAPGVRMTTRETFP